LMEEAFAELLLDDARNVEVTTVFIAFGASAVDQLVRQMQGRHTHRRRTAATILGEMGLAAASAIPALQEATMHNDDILQNKARIALTKLRKSS
jgi:hypothetical protein